MRTMRGFAQALFAGLLFGSALAVVASALGADPESAWILPILLAALLFGSLFDREGFYGEPHPFRRRSHRTEA